MNMPTPTLTVPRAPATWRTEADPVGWDWDGVTALPVFILYDGSRPAGQQTTTRVCYDAQALYVHFDCDDRDIWGTYTRRDDPIYDEEVVEVFIAPGEASPVRYFEFEVSPNGVLLDACVDNPASTRAELQVDTGWDCPGIRWRAGQPESIGHWWAVIVIPWAGLAPAGELPRVWRANFYRIERPRGGPPEYSCWSPTMVVPADFHQPACFGTLLLE